MNRYAIIETNSGYVWGVVNAQSALDACTEVDKAVGGDPGEGWYQTVPAGEWNTDRGYYDVRQAPEGFDVDDGQDREQIAAVNALPRVGMFQWIDEGN